MMPIQHFSDEAMNRSRATKINLSELRGPFDDRIGCRQRPDRTPTFFEPSPFAGRMAGVLRKFFILFVVYGCTRTVSDFESHAAPTLTDTIVLDGAAGADAAWQSSLTSYVAHWAAPTLSTNAASLGFSVSSAADCRGDVVATQKLPVSATTFSASGLVLQEGKTYFGCLLALSATGVESSGATSNGVSVDATAPSVPVTVAAQAGVNQTLLTWSNASDSGSGLYGYDVAYCNPAPCAPPAVPQLSGIGAGFSIVAPLDNCIDYDFFVRAVDVAGNPGAWTAATDATPFLDVPKDLSVVNGPAWAEVAWTPEANTQYDVCHASHAGACTGVVTDAGSRSAVRINGLTPDTAYFSVRAKQGTCTSTPSAEIEVVPFAMTLMYQTVADNSGTPLQIALDGDGDGDGKDDLIVGDPSDSLGAALISYTTDPQYPTLESIVDPFLSSNNNGQLGFSLAWIGDLTGDGRDDFVVGAPGSTTGSGRAGHLCEVNFDTALSPFDYCNLNFDIDGSTGSWIGQSVAAAGDFNNDGTPDILVGLNTSGGAGTAQSANAVVVLSGKVAGPALYTTILLNTFAVPVPAVAFGNMPGSIAALLQPDNSSNVVGVATISNSAAYLYAGASPDLLPHSAGAGQVRRIGDIDGDGVPDYGIGGSDNNAGFVTLYSKTATTLVTGASVATITGMGDVDGDGLADFATSNDNARVNGLDSAGAMDIRSGSDGHVLWHFDRGANAVAESLGTSIASGDFDGDGNVDVVVTSQSAQGSMVNFFANNNLLGLLPSEIESTRGQPRRDTAHMPKASSSGQLSFTASGGTSPYTFSIVADHSHGAAIDASGAYTCGTARGVYDTVRVTDALLRSFDTRVLCGNAPSEKLYAPTSLVAVANADQSLALTWAERSPEATGFVVEQREPTGIWHTVVAATQTHTTITGLATPATYFFRVRATHASGDSVWSPVAQIDD
jgi:hypothetical protein